MSGVRHINKKITSVHTHRGRVALTCRIRYPKFITRRFPWAISVINREYRRQAEVQSERCRSVLLSQAVDQIDEALREGYPFNAYELQVDYRITFNRDCALSLYTDSYEYTGGAHGITVRTSDTWSLTTGVRYALSDFFPPEFDVRGYILDEIIRQIAEGEDVYFPDADQLARDAFNPDSFYITDQGIVIYYQQYDIAPYASGIREFVIPYAQGAAQPPGCKGGKG